MRDWLRTISRSDSVAGAVSPVDDRPRGVLLGLGPNQGAGADVPPLWLPGGHFAAAILFWLVGAAGLVLVAPDLAAGLYPLPRVLAVTHLFTLGWITTSILGAL